MKTKNLIRALAQYERADSQAHFTGTVRRWAERSGDEELWRINAFRLADELSLDRKALVEAFITLTLAGIFELSWDFHCTECNAVAQTHRHLTDATATNHCPLCDVEFRNDLVQNVEVTFSPSERYYTVAKAFLERQQERTVELHRTKQIRHPDPRVRGIDCLHIPLFREMFESETVSVRESLRVGSVCIMFTDIKGSTSLYDRLGDSSAYGLVRTHFEILFEKIGDCGGVVVKTIGDSVMASFKRPADGVSAAVAIQTAFRELNDRRMLRNEILLKIGIHAGGTIMVNLNNRLDYFGQSVNLAARIENGAEGGEILISESVRRDAEAIAVLRGRVSSLTKRLVLLKGIHEPRPIYRLNFADQPVLAQETQTGVYCSA